MSQFLQYYKAVEDTFGHKASKECSIKIQFNYLKTHGTSLKVHVNKHPHPLATDEPTPKAPKITNFYTEKGSELPVLPKLDRMAIALCCSNHLLPFDIAEDTIFKWVCDFCGLDRKREADRITFLAKNWSDTTAGIFKNNFVSIMYDG